MLYIIPTPIGNLEDWTFRALRIAKECDYLLCEDTRHSLILLNHYQIKKPLISFHKFNEQQKEREILDDLRAGKAIGLLSDGGTPLIQDPGTQLVQRCLDEGLSLTALPGPCSLITALALTGLSEPPFQFCGFMPKKAGEKKESLLNAIFYEGSSLFFETPHELLETLKLCFELAPSISLAVARELTKTFEETIRGSAEEVYRHFQKTPPRGEMVLILRGLGTPSPSNEENLIAFTERIEKEFHLTRKEAIEIAARLCLIPKKELYKKFIENKKSDL